MFHAPVVPIIHRAANVRHYARVTVHVAIWCVGSETSQQISHLHATPGQLTDYGTSEAFAWACLPIMVATTGTCLGFAKLGA